MKPEAAISPDLFSILVSGGAEELLETANEHDLETVLDPRSVELSTEGGMARSGVSDLAWALGSEGAQTPVALRHRATEYAELLAVHAIEHNYSAVLAPTHFRETSRDEWGDVDRELTLALRAALDQGGAREVPIYYPLIATGKVLGRWEERHRLKQQLASVPIDAVWLRVHPFGTTNSGPLALRRYIEAGRDLHSLGMPLVAERVGTSGLP